LGAKRWQWLHRLVYAVALLALLHFWWMRAGKQNFAEPSLMAVIILSLLAARAAGPIQRWIRARKDLSDSHDAESR
ncbi:MAG: hypothetical protein ACO223_00810, partial [Burkholderiaceae bacterium]